MRYLILLLLITGCATEQSIPETHMAWSGKTSEHAGVVVTMDREGLLKLYIDDEMVFSRQNWCVEIVKYVPTIQ